FHGKILTHEGQNCFGGHAVADPLGILIRKGERSTGPRSCAGRTVASHGGRSQPVCDAAPPRQGRNPSQDASAPFSCDVSTTLITELRLNVSLTPRSSSTRRTTRS